MLSKIKISPVIKVKRSPSDHNLNLKMIIDWNLSETSKPFRTARLAAETLSKTNSLLKCCLFHAGMYPVLGYQY